MNAYIVYLNGTQVKTGTVIEGTNEVTGISAAVGDTIRVMVTDTNGTSGSSEYKVK